MKLGIRVHQGRLDAEQFRVIRPAKPVTGAVLGDNNPWFFLELDTDAAFALTGLWMLAARSPRALIHIPLRGNTPSPSALATLATGELDLVLSHHDLQFAPNRWRQLRRRLGTGAAHTTHWNPNDVPAWDEVHELNRRARNLSDPMGVRTVSVVAGHRDPDGDGHPRGVNVQFDWEEPVADVGHRHHDPGTGYLDGGGLVLGCPHTRHHQPVV